MTHTGQVRPHFYLFCAFVLLTRLSYGQSANGTLTGTVLDPQGGAIANAEVTATNETGGEKRTTKTGPNGAFRIENIQPSSYTLSATANGFSRKDVRGVRVSASAVQSQNITLDVGASTQVVEVTAGVAQIQTDTGELSQSISTMQVAKLPEPSLNPIDLVKTMPGVLSVAGRDDFTNGASFSVDGLRPRANNFLIDGFDNNDYGISGQALQPQNVEAVKEVSVLRNSYNPEYGRGGASVTNVIYKNGTNQLHGSGYERYNGNSLNALTSEQKRSGITEVPRVVDNTFGFTAGGPVIKNKLFLFGAAQWEHINGDETGNTLIIPTAAGVANLRSIAGASPNANILINSLGGLAASSVSSSINVGNRAGCGSPCLIPVGQIVRTPGQLSRSYEYIIRGDWNATANDTITTRFIGSHNSLTPDLFANPNALPTTDTEQGGPARNLGFYYTHVFSPTMLNELRFTYQQIDFAFAPLPSTTSNALYADPNITIAGFSGVSFGGLTSTFPQGRGHDTYQYQDAFSWAHGNHSFKAGADLTHLQIHDQIPFNARGTVSIVAGGDCSSIGLTTCTGLANFLDNFTGPSGSAGKQFGSPAVAFNWNIQAYYFQDAWRIRPTLTMTYGVRYEYYGRPFNFLPYPTVNAVSALTDPVNTRVNEAADTSDWGPRFGLAWNPNHGKTVFRMGSGVFYDGYFTNITDNVASSAPNVLGGTVVAPNTGRGSSSPLTLVSSATATLNPRASVSAVESGIRSPRTFQWNANVERQLPFDTLLTLAYVGTRANYLFVNRELNPGVNGVRLQPARGSIGTRTNAGNSEYHGLQADLRRNFKNGLFLELAYTYSKAIDNGSEVFTTSGFSSYPQNAFNMAGERGPSAFDRTHRVAVTWLYSLPYRGHSPISYLLKNWTISGTAQFQSGAPDTVFIPEDINGDLRAGSDRPDLGNIHAPVNYSDACLNSPSCITGVGTFAKNGSLVDFNTGAPGSLSQFRYIVPVGRLGNLGRNTFRNDWTQNWTLAVERIIPLPRWEGHQIELRGEAVNPWNHPNPGIISTDIDDPTFMNKSLSYTGGRSLILWGKYRF
jgi:outer membrane receptor protein involved in Fe transport